MLLLLLLLLSSLLLLSLSLLLLFAVDAVDALSPSLIVALCRHNRRRLSVSLSKSSFTRRPFRSGRFVTFTSVVGVVRLRLAPLELALVRTPSRGVRSDNVGVRPFPTQPRSSLLETKYDGRRSSRSNRSSGPLVFDARRREVASLFVETPVSVAPDLS